jgi:hypothetical protein
VWIRENWPGDLLRDGSEFRENWPCDLLMEVNFRPAFHIYWQGWMKFNAVDIHSTSLSSFEFRASLYGWKPSRDHEWSFVHIFLHFLPYLENIRQRMYTQTINCIITNYHTISAEKALFYLRSECSHIYACAEKQCYILKVKNA